jgi:hypothetical protein
MVSLRVFGLIGSVLLLMLIILARRLSVLPTPPLFPAL